MPKPRASQDKTASSSGKPATKSAKSAKPHYPKGTRPTILAQTQRELWARAAGRCEFYGCNEILYYDTLTKQRANLATIAHIVAFSPEGPRGHPTRSKELEIAIENLMLTCKKHGDLIDNLDYVDQYPEKTLLQYKADHEKRVREATAALDDAKTDLLLVQGRIRGRESVINEEDAKRAVRPRWPGSEQSQLIDLNAHRLAEDKAAYWEATAEQVTSEVRDLFKTRPGKDGVKHLSVFALAPVPLLVLLGHELSSRVDLDLFQFRRDKSSEKWCWDQGQPGPDEGFNSYEPQETVDVEDVAVVVSLSGLVDHAAISRAVGGPHVIYEIRAKKSGPDFLKYRSQLTEFGALLRHLLTSIRTDFRAARRLHFFLACPAPIAIDCGRSLIEKADPEVLVYEYAHPNYSYALTINKKGGSQ